MQLKKPNFKWEVNFINHPENRKHAMQKDKKKLKKSLCA